MKCWCGCDAEVPASIFVCGKGWAKVPRDVRKALVKNYKRDAEAQSPQFQKAEAAAKAALAQ